MKSDAKTIEFVAIAKFLKYSPYKLRPLADVVRGKDLIYALGWLNTYRNKRVEPVKKVIESAMANAKDRAGLEKSDLYISEIRIDEGPIFKYFKPGAMGRANVQRRRFCHISVKVSKKA